ncbi:MAG TPA: DUF4433 domain-containing protein [Gemmataceae bacterium]|nr:DUF4433 domain-containing protein [Gemmataceae bacterium]
MNLPKPTPIFRFLHIGNLEICLRREALHAPNHRPKDKLVYKTIHNLDIQRQRQITPIPCGPAGVIHDYVAFYFGPRSPMLLQLHTGRVTGYTERQDPLIYLVSTAQAVRSSGTGFVFSDGHGIARFTNWFDKLSDLDKVDWDAVYATIWKDTVDDMDRQRRKQAEFLVHQQCAWDLIEEIGVLNKAVKKEVEQKLAGFPGKVRRPVNVRPEWYY